eukprot:scaffold479_cov376-Prasinococcus_capsulatus_cf.AAC.6
MLSQPVCYLGARCRGCVREQIVLWSNVEDVIIGEAVEHDDVYYYLAVVVVGEESLLVPFQVWQAACGPLQPWSGSGRADKSTEGESGCVLLSTHALRCLRCSRYTSTSGPAGGGSETVEGGAHPQTEAVHCRSPNAAATNGRAAPRGSTSLRVLTWYMRPWQ